MPERTACDEAIRFSPVRLRVSDPDLKHGQVEMFQIQARAGSTIIQRPWGIEGGFAVVYRFRTVSGKLRALRCFRVPMDPDTHMRYERLAPYFAQHVPAITADVKYHEQGIMIKETVAGIMCETVYPIIEMEWIEGTTLLEKVDTLCQQHDLPELEQLLNNWLIMLSTLQKACIAHGDLSGSNIMIRTDGSLVLIDYDGCYIPKLAGMKAIVAGQPDYQHPQMQQRAFNEEMDNFSALVIYTALVALHVEPDLWNTYTLRNQRGKLIGTNMLFQQADFLDPDQSNIFADIEQINDPRVQTTIQALRQACYQQLQDVVFPWTLIDPDYQEKQALAAFRRVLATRKILDIATVYQPVLDTVKNITPQERETAKQAQSFAAAYSLDDDEALVTIFNQIIQLNPRQFAFERAEQQRIMLARQRMDTLATWRNIIRSKRWCEILHSYNSILDPCNAVTPLERDLLAFTQNIEQAFQQDDDELLAQIDAVLQSEPHQDAILLTHQEQKRLQFAVQRTTALSIFRTALQTGYVERIIVNYDPILQHSTSITQQERDLYQHAQNFKHTYDSDNDQQLTTTWEHIQQLVTTWECIQHANNPYPFQLTQPQQQRLDLAIHRTQALQHFRSIIQQQSKPRNAQQLLAAYDPILDTYQGSGCLTNDELALLDSARHFMTVYPELLTALQNNDEQRIKTLYSTSLEEFATSFTPEQQRQLKRMAKHGQLNDYLQRRDYANVVRLAIEIEKTEHILLTDASLQIAKQRFIQDQDARDVTAQIINNTLLINWRWPDNELVDIAFIFWRPDRWPNPPSRSEMDTQQRIVMRNPRENHAIVRLTCPYQQAYIQIFTAIADYTQRRVNYFYSRGREQTSRFALLSWNKKY